MPTISSFVFAALLTLGSVAEVPQPQPSQHTGRIVVETIRATTLQDTVTGEDPDRTVAVYLPPAYFTETDRRFPTLYLLHGIGDTQTVWTSGWFQPGDPWSTIDGLFDRGISGGWLRQMIVVMPDQRTLAGGSFYTDSSVTGRWQEFTARELPAWIDGRFRTLASAESRGVAGHSMGGYGAIMLAMKYPETFSAAYGMSPALLGWGGDFTGENPAFRSLPSREGWQDLRGFFERGFVVVAQAFSPNPDKPPFFADLPFSADDEGAMVATEPAHARWQSHLPIHLVERYRDNLLKLRGLRFDAGTADQFSHIPQTSRELSQRLTDLQIPHVFEQYNGDHRNRLWGRSGRLYTEVLPWFSLLLESE